MVLPSLKILYILLLVAISYCKREEPDILFKKILKKNVLPSWQFENIERKWNGHRQLFNDKGLNALSIFVQEFERSYKVAKSELVTMFGEESMIESRLRSLQSISNQLDDDKNMTVKDIYDVIIWRITFPTVKQVSNINSVKLFDKDVSTQETCLLKYTLWHHYSQLINAKYKFVNNSRFGVAIVKCFGVCPRAGKHAATGYRGITLIAEIDGKPTEIQLMTPYMVMWADWAYGVLLDEFLGSRQEVKEYGLHLSNYYYSLDSMRDKRPSCPETLRKANMKKVTKKLVERSDIFDSLGAPPSGCQFWNDLAVNKNKNIGARRAMLDTVEASKKKGHGNRLSVIDIDKILTPENLKEKKQSTGKGQKRTLESVWPAHLYY